MKRQITTLIYLFATTLTFAQPQRLEYTALEGQEERVDIKAGLFVAVDTSRNMGLSEADKLQFQPLSEQNRPQSSEYAYWVRVRLVNKSDSNEDWIVDGGNNNASDLYIVRNRSISKQISGETRKISAKSIPQGRKESFFRVNLPFQDSVTLYLRTANSMGHVPKLELGLIPEEKWEAQQRDFFILQSLFLGALMMMMGYNIAVWISTRENAYGYYAVFILLNIIYFGWYHGFIHTFLLPEYPEINIHFWILSITLPIAYILFTRKLLDLPRRHPNVDRFARYMLYANIAMFLVGFGNFVLTNDLALSIQLVNGTIIADALMFIVMLYKLRKAGSSLLRYFIAGLLIFIVFSALGIISHTYFNWLQGVYLAQVGVVGHILFHSIGLGQKLRDAERAKHHIQQQLIKQLEENHRIQEEANVRLEEKVLARTEEIQSQKEQIEEQNEELKALNEEKNNLIRIVAHDLKSPLARMTGLVNVIKLQPDNLTEEQLQLLGLINTTGEKLKSMVSRILDVDSVGKQEAKLRIEAIDLPGFLAKYAESFQARAEEKYININTEIGSSEALAKLDPDYLDQIVENLFSNAIKFSPKGKNILVGLDKGEDQVRFFIKDQGPGLTEEDHDKLFKKYQKLSAQPTAGEDSTGLGLSIVKRYVELMKGRIWCESEYGKGATFFVSFPLASSAELVA